METKRESTCEERGLIMLRMLCSVQSSAIQHDAGVNKGGESDSEDCDGDAVRQRVSSYQINAGQWRRQTPSAC